YGLLLQLSCRFFTVHLACTPPATTDIYTLSLHDAFRSPRADAGQQGARDRRGIRLPDGRARLACKVRLRHRAYRRARARRDGARSEEHTSELQSQSKLVCRLLLEKKNNNTHTNSARHGD